MTGPVAYGRHMKNGALKLTDAEIEAGKSAKGGFTRAQLAAWGVSWPPMQGWRAALLAGRPIPKRRNRLGREKRLSTNTESVKVNKTNQNCSVNLARLENQVYRLAAYLIERGHHDAAEALAGDARGAALYLARPATNDTQEQP